MKTKSFTKAESLTKEEYLIKKGFILSNSSLTVSTENISNSKKFEHAEIISSELGILILFISNSNTEYSFLSK